MRTSDQVFSLIVFVVGWIVWPASLIWGWARFLMQPKQWNLASMLSLMGFLLASASALLALSSMMYAQEIHGFRYYDPLLLKIFRAGGLISVAGIVFGIGGVWRKNSLRWQSPVAALGALAFWLGMATAE